MVDVTIETTTRGLAPFDEPVYLEQPGGQPDVRPPDVVSRPVIGFLCRACLLSTLAAIVPFLTDDDVRVALGVTLTAHLGLTTLLDISRVGAERGRPWLSLLLVVLDTSSLTALAVLSGRGVVIGAIGLLMIAFHRWLYGRRSAAVSVVLLASAFATLVGLDEVDSDWFAAGSVAVVGGLLVWLVDDQATRHTETSRGFHLVATRAEAVLEGIGDAIVTTDRRGRLRELNPAAAELLGCEPRSVAGLPCAMTLRLLDDSGEIDCSNGCGLLALGGSSVEVRRKGPQGNRQPLLATAVALRDEDGEPIEVVHLLRDITSLKQADEAKTLFLATASHELKTPLAVIRGYAQLLSMDCVEDHERARALESIQVRSGQLVSIVDRLLMSSRIDAGHIDLRPELRPIDEILRERVADFSASRRMVDLAIDDDLPSALSDDSALATIVDHLLENADKYSPAGGPVSLTATADDDHVRIAVRDAGIGMTPSQIERCFERFWQAEGTDVRRFGGTGIGLYIVKSLTDALRGTVEVVANDGPGITATLSLRRYPVEAVPVAPTADTDGPGSAPVEGEASMIREFMRQMGVLTEVGDR